MRLRREAGTARAVSPRCAQGHEVTEMRHRLARCWEDEQGLTTVEYALLLPLIVVSAITGWQNFGQCLANSADEPIRVMQASTQ